jgi:phage/plasmid-like protein (TIGR03299 family)
MTDKRGQAWHWREGTDNHYPGAIPVEHVLKRLFHWQADERPLFLDGGVPVVGRKAIVRSDNGHVMGIFKDGYRPHQYEEWLIDNVSTILDDDLSISSAGLLKGGAVAWVEVSVPETITTPEGVDFRPNLLACTSFDGSISTTYNRNVVATVCDNTLDLALMRGRDQQVKIRHSKNSLAKITDVREALAIVHSDADDFAAEVAKLTSIQVDHSKFEEIVDAIIPLPKVEEGKSTRGVTIAERKRETLWGLWQGDERVTPWQGTAYGALAAFNTFYQHELTGVGNNRAERNMLMAVDGRRAKEDYETLTKIMELAA